MKNEFDDFDFDGRNHSILNKVILIVAIVIVLVGAFVFMKYFLGKIKDDSQNAISSQTANETLQATYEETEEGKEVSATVSEQNSSILEEPSQSGGEDELLQKEAGTSENNESISEQKPVNILVSSDVKEVEKVCTGIDVSKYQGVINWKKVASSGVEFAMIRVGNRTLDSGEIKEDDYARYNLQEATANGIKVGVYFFSTAINETEAVQEAEWVVDLIKNYEITYPVAFNCEGYDKSGNRQFSMTNEERTDCAIAFLNKVYEAGYTPMFYASKNQMTNSRDWVMSDLECSYKVWLSWYAESIYAQTGVPDYAGSYAIWQYTNSGSIDGIQTSVDKNVAYFGYDSVAAAHDGNKPQQVKADYEAMMAFSETSYEATAKNETNLRDIPSQGEDSHVKHTLKHGESVTVTGISDTGWARVRFDGNTYYAVSNLLTTDFSAPAGNEAPIGDPVEPDNGIKTVFSECHETVTPKIEVNLRALPSVTNPDAVVVATVKNGEMFTRTGYNTEYGWSRVEYNGQTLYCVSSYLWVVQQ